MGKLVVIGQCGCIRAKFVVFGKSGCIWPKLVRWSKLVVFEQIGCNFEKWL